MTSDGRADDRAGAGQTLNYGISPSHVEFVCLFRDNDRSHQNSIICIRNDNTITAVLGTGLRVIDREDDYTLRS